MDWIAFLMDLLKVLGGFIAGAIAGFFLARTYMKKYMKKNPPINEQMIKGMMMQMGRKPSQKQELPTFQISCYQQLCLPFPKEVLFHYFQEKYHLSHNKEIFHLPHETYQIRSSYLKVTTEKQIPSIFFLICHIDPHIFLCDFQNGDYFYLNDFYSQTKIKS